MIDEYNSGYHEFCIDLIAELLGKFGGELDTFYHTILDKINGKLRKE